MGVYIKGMEMPKSCHACCFFGQADIWESDFDGYTKSFCKRTGSQTYDYVDKFLPNCPLVPVPSHGALMDRDEFFAACPELVDGYKRITDGLVVIPASEEGE